MSLDRALFSVRHRDAKRRKIRKGTRSCWECKRRKMKCIFPHTAGSDTKCQGCERRGSACISQEFSVTTSVSSGFMSTSDTAHIDEKRPEPDLYDENPGHGFPTPVSTNSEHSLLVGGSSNYGAAVEQGCVHNANTSEVRNKNLRLSYRLHESLPSLEDTEWIIKASRYSSGLALQSLMVPYKIIEGLDGKGSWDTTRIPGRTAHPVLFARHMLQLAACLHHLHANDHKDGRVPGRSRREMMERLADIAISLVTTNDDLLGSIEGLQCVMIESIYHVNKGTLRRGWVACRRAITIAQLMGIDRSANQTQHKVLDPGTKYNSQHMWFRMVALERHLCLMMGLPQGSLDRSMASDTVLAGDTPMGRLERMHCVLACRILERNESTAGSDDKVLTRDLDLDLQKTARIFPSKWWLPPSLTVESIESEDLFWEARRLFAQVFHYSLVLQLHMPYMLHFTTNQGVCDYSRVTCVNASREVISRFIILRSSLGIALDCRTIDFFALMAAMTLLVAHLEGHGIGMGNLLAHQYMSDRAMIEQVQDCMEELHRLNADALSAQSAHLLRRLLTMEAEVVSGSDGQPKDTPPAAKGQDDHIEVSVSTPYYNIIKIAREGMRRDVPQSHSAMLQPEAIAGLADDSSLSPQPAGMANGALLPEGGIGPLQDQFLSSDAFLQQDWFSSLVADGEDSAFQGVDLAFFDTLMRSSGGDDSLDLSFSTEASSASKL